MKRKRKKKEEKREALSIDLLHNLTKHDARSINLRE